MSTTAGLSGGKVVRASGSGLGAVVTLLVVQPGEVVQRGEASRRACGQSLVLLDGQLATSRQLVCLRKQCPGPGVVRSLGDPPGQWCLGVRHPGAAHGGRLLRGDLQVRTEGHGALVGLGCLARLPQRESHVTFEDRRARVRRPARCKVQRELQGRITSLLPQIEQRQQADSLDRVAIDGHGLLGAFPRRLRVVERQLHPRQLDPAAADAGAISTASRTWRIASS